MLAQITRLLEYFQNNTEQTKYSLLSQVTKDLKQGATVKFI